VPLALETFLARHGFGSTEELWLALEAQVKRREPRAPSETIRKWLAHVNVTDPERSALGSLAQAEGVAGQTERRRQVAGALEDACLR
jgi:hypothetical protein